MEDGPLGQGAVRREAESLESARRRGMMSRRSTQLSCLGGPVQPGELVRRERPGQSRGTGPGLGIFT
jgi:hypothetical protein